MDIKTYNGIPMLNKDEYAHLMSTFTTEEILDAFVDTFSKSRNKPYSFIPAMDEEKVSRKLLKLRDSSPVWIYDEDVVMKHEYKFDLGECLGITQLGHYYNDISNPFHLENRMMCGGYDRVSPIKIWNGDGLTDTEWKTLLKGFLSPLFRKVNTMQVVSMRQYKGCFRLSSSVYNAPQFKVHVVKQIIEKFSKTGRVLDFSSGWGDRLAGFFASNNAEAYFGTDPNGALQDGYKAQVELYKKVLGSTATASVSTYPSEHKIWVEKVDLVFTSPPYYSTERYAEGTEFERQQSWSRFPSYEEWKHGFLYPSLSNSDKALLTSGIVALNIFNIDIRKEHYPVVEDARDFLMNIGYDYKGFVGMRMKQRPKNFKNKEHKDAYMSSNYVEPIWIFEKR